MCCRLFRRLRPRLRFWHWFLSGLSLLLLAPLLLYGWISWRAAPYQYDDLEALPARSVGLVLGTSKYLGHGQINLYYRGRIEAALALYRAGKVRYFIVSGDNRSVSYNEPRQMRLDLIAGGVPAHRIQPDFAGLRTLDSVLRAAAIFGQDDYIIISQSFHNARALWLARARGQHPIAFNAPNPRRWRHRLKTELREVGARLKALWDLLSQKQARHYGPPIDFPPPPEPDAP